MSINVLIVLACLAFLIVFGRKPACWLIRWDARRRERKWARRRAYRRPGLLPIFDDQYEPPKRWEP